MCLLSVCTQLLVASRPDDECFNLYIQLIDKCINHEVRYFYGKQESKRTNQLYCSISLSWRKLYRKKSSRTTDSSSLLKRLWSTGCPTFSPCEQFLDFRSTQQWASSWSGNTGLVWFPNTTFNVLQFSHHSFRRELQEQNSHIAYNFKDWWIGHWQW